MIKAISKASAFSFLKTCLILAITVYGFVTTVLLLRLRPVPLVIGIDAYGTRIITGNQDPILKSEKEAFIRMFLSRLYNYEQSNFDSQVSLAGDLMAADLWNEKNVEFRSISDRIKTEPLTTTARLLDLREIDGSHFEADLMVAVQKRMSKSEIKIRVRIEIEPGKRSIQNPYPWEVREYEEQTDN